MLALLIVVVLLFITLFVRLFYLIIVTAANRSSKEVNFWKSSKLRACVLVVLGSGGHTKEMLSLVKSLGTKFTPRCYVVADTDTLSVEKAINLQKELDDDDYEILKVPRSREVQQSYLSSVVSTLRAVTHALPIVLKAKPDVILCNGPGTCIPLCVSAFVLQLFFIRHISIVYIESVCRVTSLSLSGKVLYFFVDSFVVQWPELARQHAMATYIGRLL